MTSKCHSLEDLHNHLNLFGFRGEALASVREVSGLLTFESRPKGSDVTYCKVFTHGKSHRAGISKTMRPGQGTTITVHDFMYNMPVRRQRIRSAIDLEEIKSHIECIALMHPQVNICRTCEYA
jgi:DNA mismatch repair protein MLH3